MLILLRKDISCKCCCKCCFILGSARFAPYSPPPQRIYDEPHELLHSGCNISSPILCRATGAAPPARPCSLLGCLYEYSQHFKHSRLHSALTSVITTVFEVTRSLRSLHAAAAALVEENSLWYNVSMILLCSLVYHKNVLLL